MYAGVDVQAVRALSDPVDHVDDPPTDGNGRVYLLLQRLEGLTIAAAMPQGIEVDIGNLNDLVVERPASGDEQLLDQRLQALQRVSIADFGVAAVVAEDGF